jgi:hypothetical protein
MAAPDGPRRLALAMEHGSKIYQRLGPVWPAILAAMGEPEVRAAWQSVVGRRREGMRRLVDRMAERGGLRPSGSAQHGYFREKVIRIGRANFCECRTLTSDIPDISASIGKHLQYASACMRDARERFVRTSHAPTTARTRRGPCE